MKYDSFSFLLPASHRSSIILHVECENRSVIMDISFTGKWNVPFVYEVKTLCIEIHNLS
jgi:hypothetical protein